RGHFYFGHTGHYHFGTTGRNTSLQKDSIDSGTGLEDASNPCGPSWYRGESVPNPWSGDSPFIVAPINSGERLRTCHTRKRRHESARPVYTSTDAPADTSPATV